MSIPPRPDGNAVLIVYPFCLDHVGHGNIQRILAIARYLTANGFAVDLVYQGSASAPRVESQYGGFRRVFAVEGGTSSSDEETCSRRLTAFYGCHELPPANMRPSAPLTMLVRALIEAGSYQAAIATYAFTAPIFSGLRRPILTVCDTQDVMHEHSDACQQATGQKSTFTLPQATEEFLWRQWDVLVAITPEDEARIRRDMLPNQHLIGARHASGTCAPAAAPGADDVALYAGSSNQSNVQAVTWLLEAVWPLVRQKRPTARLRVAGLICSVLPEHLKHTPGVELLGFQESLTEELAGCGVLLAPYLYGSGLKIKVVEAACAGKAVVTTSAGLRGTGLEAGRALEVHDHPEAYAHAVAGLLGDRQRRDALAEHGRVQAAAVFSDEACYEPLATTIRLLGSVAAAPAAHAIAPGALERVRLVVDHVRPERLILWGNGAHTRALIRALAAMEVRVDLIVDGRAPIAGISPEGLPITPVTEVASAPGDLIVLSSETFESEMWRDLAPCRHAGGHVMGLGHTHYISRALIDRLTHRLRRQLGVAPLEATRTDTASTVVLWDSGAAPDRWWRVCAQRDAAAAVSAAGASAIVVMPTAMAEHVPLLTGMPANVQVLPLLALHGEETDERDIEGMARGLARASDVMARMSSDVVARLHLRERDVLLLMEPSLSECLGWEHTLRALGTRCPAIAIWASASVLRPGQLANDEHRAYWRLAIGGLADATDGRLTIVTSEAVLVGDLRDCLGHPVHAVDHPTAVCESPTRGSQPSIVCLGNRLESSHVRAMLDALTSAPGTARNGASEELAVSWWSGRHAGWLGAREYPHRWAPPPQVAMLDGTEPLDVRATLASADVIVVFSESTEAWLPSVRAHARAAGVPVVVPTSPADLAEQVRTALAAPRVPARPVDPMLGAAGMAEAFARLLGVSESCPAVAA